MQEIGKTLIIFGVILLGLGLILTFMNKIPFIRLRAEDPRCKPGDECEQSALRRMSLSRVEGGPAVAKRRWVNIGTTAVKLWGSIGRLPGDILIQKKNFTFYFPLATSILVSIILSLIFWLWSRR